MEPDQSTAITGGVALQAQNRAASRDFNVVGMRTDEQQSRSFPANCISIGFPPGPPCIIVNVNCSTPSILPVNSRHLAVTSGAAMSGLKDAGTISIHASPQWPPNTPGFQSLRGIIPTWEKLFTIRSFLPTTRSLKCSLS